MKSCAFLPLLSSFDPFLALGSPLSSQSPSSAFLPDLCVSPAGGDGKLVFFFFFLSLAYFAQNKDQQFNPLNYKWHNLILCSGWVKFQCVCIAYFFIHLCVDEYLVWFYFLDIGLMHRWWAHKCICVWYDDLGPFGYMPRNGIDGSCGTSLSSIRRSLHSDFHCGGTKLTFPLSM